jgi:hypothetical protein
MINYKPLIISRTLPHLGGRERVVQSLLNYFKDNGGVTLVTPDKINGVVGINVIQYDENLEHHCIDYIHTIDIYRLYTILLVL